MPVVKWLREGQEPRCEEGTVKILAASLFISGTKRRKIAELAGAPQRGGQGQLLLRFSDGERCFVRFGTLEECDAFEQAVLSVLDSHNVDDALGSKGAPPPQSAGRPSAAAALAASVRAALASAESKLFVNPMPAKLPGELDSDIACKLLTEVCSAWESIDSRRSLAPRRPALTEPNASEDTALIKRLEDENRDTEFKLARANDDLEALRKTMAFQQTEMSLLRQRVSTSAAGLRKANELKHLEEEVKLLRQRLLNETTQGKRRVREDTTPPKGPAPKAARFSCAASPEDALAQSIAQHEGAPLQECSHDDRAALKKKLLLKWHPDKQPSESHVNLAKKVMQEMQNLVGWKD